MTVFCYNSNNNKEYIWRLLSMISTRDKAFELIYEAEKCNPGPWVQHSICVAECAEKIAIKCGMDSEKAFVMGLLHDIGRKFGVTHLAHVLDGYNYLMSLGYQEQAKICLTHSFAIKRIEDYIGNHDISQQDKDKLTQILNNCEYDDYDLLIQLCDTLAGVEVMEMSKRMDDVERRYAHFPQSKRLQNQKLKIYFENKANENIYKVITENSALWGL